MNFNIIIDKKVVIVNNSMTILQACESANILVPKFCYHERLSIAGNCRMCLVEIDKAPKLVASCAMPVIQNMVIHTNSLAVKKAREGILEFLLINHPLDCGICDQAGECDLQEQSKGFGSDRGRFHENKRAVQDFECGPLIKTIMSRCIHCTRCVRFANEIIGMPDLGTTGRGGALEINLYIKKLFKSEFSGNLIDLCPVGALTSKPYTFTARSWELKSIESIDVLDGIGSNIRLDTRGYELMRILPRLNENINEEWISDKTRFAFDGLRQQRLYEPLLKGSDGTFVVIQWKHAINLIFEQLNKIKFPNKLGAIIGAQADLESVILLNYLIKKYNGNFIDFTDFDFLEIDFRFSYLFNSGFKNIENADVCLLLGVNPRIEGAILSLRLRKRYLSGNFKIASFGSYFDVSFPIYNLGSTVSTFLKFIEGRHIFSKYFSKAKNPIVIIGQSFFEMLGQKQIWSIIKVLTKNSCLLKKKWCGINILNNKASAVGKYETGIKAISPINVNLDVLYVLGEGKIKRMKPSAFVIYQGYQANDTTNMANLILPGKAFTEKMSTFINTEGRYQLTKSAISSPATSKDDWTILYAILEKVNLISFAKIAVLSNTINSFLLDTKTLLQKIEMDPFYGIATNKLTVIELNFSNHFLSTTIINRLNKLNCLENISLDEGKVKVFSELIFKSPDLYTIYIKCIEFAEEIAIKSQNFPYFIGISFIQCLQNVFFFYIFENNTKLLILINELFDFFEFQIKSYLSWVSDNNELYRIKTGYATLYTSNDVDRHVISVFYNLFTFSPLLTKCTSGCDEKSDDLAWEVGTFLYQDYKTVFAYFEKTIFNITKKFFSHLPKLLRLGDLESYQLFDEYHEIGVLYYSGQIQIDLIYGTYDDAEGMDNFFKIETFYSFLGFLKSKMFKNITFLNRYKSFFIFEENMKYIDFNNEIFPIFDFKTFCSFYNDKHYKVFCLKLKSSLLYFEGENSFLNNFYDHENQEDNLMLKVLNTYSPFSIDQFKPFYIPTFKYNLVLKKSSILKNICFLRSLKNISFLCNNILPSAKFDNFYLMQDFSKFSILMKYCSDLFLERAPFKKY